MRRALITGPALTMREAAAYIGLPHRTMQQVWVRTPGLASCAVRVGRRVNFLRGGLDAYLRSQLVAGGAR